MATQTITPDQKVFDYLQEWHKGKAYVDIAIRDFKRLDTIANAQYDGGNNKNPNIGDTTVAGILRQIMRTAVKKIPHVTMAINGSATTVEALTCSYLVDNNILNPNTFGKGFVNILHLGGRGSISRGFNVFQVSATKMYGEFGIVPKLIHFNDFIIEPGIQEGSHSPYWQIRTKMTPGKVQGIYNREKAKPAGQSTWNIPALKALIETGPDSSGSADYAMYVTPMEQSKVETGAETYDIITRYSANPEDNICTYSPSINQVLREVSNRSKFGYPRILFLVIDPAELSPFGDSRVRLASPNQNFLMALRQNVGTTWLYNSKPVVVKTGVFMGATSLKSGGTISSSDPNAKVSLLTMDTVTSQQYPTISQEIVRQIQTMMGMNPGQALGAIGDSKTGVGAQAQKQGIDDAIQQITTIMEEFLRHYVISALDLYLSEQDGEGVIYVDDSTRERIKQINPKAFPDPDYPNGLKVNWNQLYDHIQKIDASIDTTMSKEDWSNEKRSDLQDALTVMKQTANPDDPVAQAKINAVEDELLDEIVPEVSQTLEANKAQSPAAPATPQGSGQTGPRPPSESITFGDAVKAGAYDTAAAMADQAGLPSNDLKAASPNAIPGAPVPTQPPLTPPGQ